MHPTECVWGINSKVVSSMEIGKGIGCHPAAVARLATMMAAGTKGSSRHRQEEMETRKKRGKVDSRRADGKSMDLHSETT